MDTYVYCYFFLITPFLYTCGYCNNLEKPRGPPAPKSYPQVIHKLYMSYTGPVHKVCISYPQVIHELSTGPQVGTGIAWWPRVAIGSSLCLTAGVWVCLWIPIDP